MINITPKKSRHYSLLLMKAIKCILSMKIIFLTYSIENNSH
jgi:hypothetical protein